MKDQKVGKGVRGVLSAWLGKGIKWGFIAVLFAMVDARMGGAPRLLEVLGEVGRAAKLKSA